MHFSNKNTQSDASKLKQYVASDKSDPYHRAGVDSPEMRGKYVNTHTQFGSSLISARSLACSENHVCVDGVRLDVVIEHEFHASQFCSHCA